MEQIYASVSTAFGSYGATTAEVVEYFRKNPDVLDVLVRASGPTICYCFCQWTHVGHCNGSAQTTRISGGNSLPFCEPCARALDVRRRGELDGHALPPTDLIGS